MVTDKIKESHFYGSNKHTSDNISKIINENKFIIKSSKILNKWLNYKGIQLYILSELSKLDESIPRIDANKVYKYITCEKDIEYINPINPVNKTDDIDLKKYFKIDTLTNIFQFIQIEKENDNNINNGKMDNGKMDNGKMDNGKMDNNKINDKLSEPKKNINKLHNFSRIKFNLINKTTNVKHIES